MRADLLIPSPCVEQSLVKGPKPLGTSTCDGRCQQGPGSSMDFLADSRLHRTSRRLAVDKGPSASEGSLPAKGVRAAPLADWADSTISRSERSAPSNCSTRNDKLLDKSTHLDLGIISHRRLPQKFRGVKNRFNSSFESCSNRHASTRYRHFEAEYVRGVKNRWRPFDQRGVMQRLSSTALTGARIYLLYLEGHRGFFI